MRKHHYVRVFIRLTIIASFTLVGMYSYEAQAAAYNGRYNDFSLDGNALPKCPDTFECVFSLRIRGIEVDALKCAKNKVAFGKGCNNPGHFHEDFDVPLFALPEDCAGSGESAVCKIRLHPAYTLQELAELINAENPTGNLVPLHTDPQGTTCPALLPRKQTVDVIGLVCDQVVDNMDGSFTCVNQQGAYYNGFVPFNPLFTGGFQESLCPHGNFHVNSINDCVDTSAPFLTCSTSFPPL